MKTLEVLETVLKGKRIKPATQRHYRETLKSLAEYASEWPESGLVINEWLVSLTQYSDTTIVGWFDVVNSAGKYIKRVFGLTNPCDKADRPKAEKKRRRYFSVDELVRIIKACRYEQDKALILTLIDSTCRIGELVGLKGEMVGEAWINVSGKAGERRYRLDAAICTKLKEMAGGNDQPVFKNISGEVAQVGSLKKRVRRVVKEAGITGSKLGPHTLRHSGASLVAQETGSALAVKALLQHDKIETSMIYIHDVEDVLQQRISPLRLIGEQLFKGSGFGIGEKVKQLAMSGDIIEVEVNEFSRVESEVVGGVLDLLDEQFPEIKDGVQVRSLMKTDDLRLLREAFIGYIRSGMAGTDEEKLRSLMRRMLRKVK